MYRPLSLSLSCIHLITAHMSAHMCAKQRTSLHTGNAHRYAASGDMASRDMASRDMASGDMASGDIDMKRISLHIFAHI